MPLASAPTTPERPTQAPGFRRAFTAPIKSSKTPSQRKDKQDDNADTLFAHDAATIISFTASQPADRRDSLASKVQDGSIMQYSGTLPWASLTERTVAAGMLLCVLKISSIDPLNRSPSHISCSRHSLPPLRQYLTASAPKVSVLVCRRRL